MYYLIENKIIIPLVRWFTIRTIASLLLINQLFCHSFINSFFKVKQGPGIYVQQFWIVHSKSFRLEEDLS
jgi:hypothetical protein